VKRIFRILNFVIEGGGVREGESKEADRKAKKSTKKKKEEQYVVQIRKKEKNLVLSHLQGGGDSVEEVDKCTRGRKTLSLWERRRKEKLGETNRERKER